MSEVNEPKQDRVGDDYSQGPNPNPGGDIDTSGSTLPPYEGRTTGEHPVEAGPEPHRHEDEDEETDADPEDLTPPKGVGESTGQRGEDVIDRDGKEPGRSNIDDDSQRPAGGSTPRDQTVESSG